MEKDKFQNEVDTNFKWFKENKDKILKENSDKINQYLLIKNKEIIGIYPTNEEVLLVANEKFGEDEPYSIQLLEENESINKLGFIGLKWH